MTHTAHMNKFLFFSITLFTSCSFGNESGIITYAQEHLRQTGILKNTNGFVYLDINDNYIFDLVPLIQETGFKSPPYFGKEGLVGAHISVIFPDELNDIEIDECGEEFSFRLMNCIAIAPEQYKGLIKFYLLIVEAPELNSLREKYGLEKSEHNFHITIGLKQKCPLTLDASGHFQTMNSLD
ncbi:MAG: hypothetical protein ChlgKO_04580 [Chlamydiales bacterium]